MLGKLLVLGALACFACSSETENRPVTCAKTERSGTYAMRFTERAGGTCGAIPEQLGRLDDAEALLPGCQLDAADRWSADECKLERAYTCPEPGIGSGVTSQSVAVSTQMTEDASRIDGTITLTIKRPDGTALCKSTYDATFVRQ